jgi:hypothetical protein
MRRTHTNNRSSKQNGAYAPYVTPQFQLKKLAVLFDHLLSIQLDAVIHVVLDRVSGHAETGNFIHLQSNISINKIVGEHSPAC